MGGLSSKGRCSPENATPKKLGLIRNFQILSVKTNSSHLKMDAWKMILEPFGDFSPISEAEVAVGFREYNLLRPYSCEHFFAKKRLELIVVVATSDFFCVHLVKEVYQEDRKEDCFFFPRVFFLPLDIHGEEHDLFFLGGGLLVVSLNFFELCLKWVLLLLNGS